MFNKILNLFKQEENEQESTNEEMLPTDINEALRVMGDAFYIDINQDVIVRELDIPHFPKRVALFYIDTITDELTIQNSIVNPLLTNEEEYTEISEIVSTEMLEEATDMQVIMNKITSGSTAIFVDDSPVCYIVNSEKFEGRGVEKAENETTFKGPQDAFTEQLSINTNLIRKRVKNEKLVSEEMTVGKRTQDSVSIMYLADIVNNDVLQEARDRLAKLDVASIQNISLLVQYIGEKKHTIFPTILESERPDRAVAFIENGHIVLLMDNSPSCLILPVSIWSFLHSSDDDYLSLLFGNFTRLLRGIAIFITLFTSAFYVAITNFHTEMIPADLLLAIAATREKVPFPALVEVLLMELSFELIREAGLRVPTPIGPTIGIVGALILGQAATDANIVSPIVVIVVALSGLSSFIITNNGINFIARLSRILFILAAGTFGLYGIVALFLVGMYHMASVRSFGIPYFAPYSPYYNTAESVLFRKSITKEEYRTPYVDPKDLQKKQSDSNE